MNLGKGLSVFIYQLGAKFGSLNAHFEKEEHVGWLLKNSLSLSANWRQFNSDCFNLNQRLRGF